MLPLCVGKRAERRARVAKVSLYFLQSVERPAARDVALHAEERGPGNERPDVVEHEAPDRRVRGGEQHPEQAAHRGTDPVEPGAARAPQPARVGNEGSIDFGVSMAPEGVAPVRVTFDAIALYELT